MRKPIIISACLVGQNTRYDGGNARSEEAMNELQGRQAIPVCPEMLGGLPCPRPRAEIQGGNGMDVLDFKARVVNENGTDVTKEFIKGAEAVLRIARAAKADTAFFKEKSPSCGVENICAGGVIVKGSGVAAAMLLSEGFIVKGF